MKNWSRFLLYLKIDFFLPQNSMKFDFWGLKDALAGCLILSLKGRHCKLDFLLPHENKFAVYFTEWPEKSILHPKSRFKVKKVKFKYGFSTQSALIRAYLMILSACGSNIRQKSKNYFRQA